MGIGRTPFKLNRQGVRGKPEAKQQIRAETRSRTAAIDEQKHKKGIGLRIIYPDLCLSFWTEMLPRS